MNIRKGRIPRSNSNNLDEGGSELRRGPWTLEEDSLLIQYITHHGEGQWNSLAKCAGLNRTGKSCRLRWLNYLKPDIKRGNLTPHEQLLILELHSRWGNRWSKIAQHLPGRTDNEIKNYWRTRVQKHARQLRVDSNSKKFLEIVRLYWMPRLLEKMEQNPSLTSSPSSSVTTLETQNLAAPSPLLNQLPSSCPEPGNMVTISDNNWKIPEISGFCTPSGAETLFANLPEDECCIMDTPGYDMQELEARDISLHDCHVEGDDWCEQESGSSFWNSDELWQRVD